MCGKSQYVTTPDSKRGKTENGPYKSEKIKKIIYLKKNINEKMNRNVYQRDKACLSRKIK